MKAAQQRKRFWAPVSLFFCTLLGGLLLTGWGGGGSPLPWREQLSPAGSEVLARVLPTDWAGVYTYRIPGEWETDGRVRAGVLHIFLKAMRWPQAEDGGHHLRARGFVAFEAINPFARYVFRNVGEVATRLRLLLRSNTAGWEREVAISFGYSGCQQLTVDPAFDFQRCVSSSQAVKSPDWLNLGIIDLDFGPSDAVDPDFELLVAGWIRHVSLKSQLEEALARPAAAPEGPGVVPSQPYGTPDNTSVAGQFVSVESKGAGRPPPKLLQAFPYFYRADFDRIARILQWSQRYHKPLGFAGVVMYVLRKDVHQVEAHPGLRALMEERWLTVVLWDEFSWHEGHLDFDLQVVETHSVLSHWGQHARILVGEIDEFLVPAASRTPVPQLRGEGGCLASLRDECVMIRRRNVWPTEEPLQQGMDDWTWWAGTSLPLDRYKYASDPPEQPKLLLDPNKVFPIDVHYSAVCTGTAEVVSNSSNSKLRSGCHERSPCMWVPEECAWIAHIINMHGNRTTLRKIEKMEPVTPPDWLWMLGEEE